MGHRAGTAEEERGPEAVDRIPTGEDDQGDGNEALAAGESFIPGAGVIEREKGAADAGEEAAGHGGEHADAVDGIAHGAGGLGGFADGADDHAPARGFETPREERGEEAADDE